MELIDRLFEFGKYWGIVKYFHPHILINDIDWDSIFVDHYPDLIMGNSSKYLSETIYQMQKCLNDPFCDYTIQNQNLLFEPDNSYLFSTDLIINIRINNYEDSEKNKNFLMKALNDIPKAKGLILDLRNDDKDVFDINKVFKETQFFQHFTTKDIPFPCFLEISYEGFPPFHNTESSIYHSSVKIFHNGFMQPVKNSIELPMVIILNHNSWISKEMYALNAAKKAVIVTDDYIDYSKFNQGGFEQIGLAKIGFLLRKMIYQGNQNAPFFDRKIQNHRDSEIVKYCKELLYQFKNIEWNRESIDLVKSLNLKQDFSRYQETIFPEEALRVLAIFKIYTIIKYFFPHLNKIKEDWDDVFKRSIQKAIKCKNAVDFYYIIREMTACLGDSHVFVTGYTRYYENAGIPPFNCSWVEDKPVITSFVDEKTSKQFGIEIGDIIQKINGKSYKKRVDFLAKMISASREEILMRDVMNELLKGKISDQRTLIIENTRGIEKKITFELKETYENAKYSQRDEIEKITNNILYVDLTRVSDKHINIINENLNNSRGVIFDQRGYPNLDVKKIVELITSKNRVFWAHLQVPVVSAANFQDIDSKLEIIKTLYEYVCIENDKSIQYVNVVVLIDENTQSYGETSAMFLKDSCKATLIGRQTAGANGDVSLLGLPGRIAIYFTGMTSFLSNGINEHQNGISPDIYVEQSLTGIRENRDEILNRSIEFLEKNNYSLFYKE
jgi:C-terminal processing protease CtpA/Prc